MTTASPTFGTLRAKARKLDTRRGSVGELIEELIDNAEINANDTCFTEKTCSEDEWEKVFMSSLELHLGFTTDKRVSGWFFRQGVRW